MIAWSSIEDAVRAWVLSASGLAAEAVYFADQAVPASELGARIVVRLGDVLQVGTDALEHTYSDARPVGAEIEYTARGPRELVVSLQAFAPATVGSGTTARSLLAACQAALGLPSVRDALNLAGLGVLQEGAIQRIPGTSSNAPEDRAVLDTRFCLGQTTTERTGYIATVELVPTLTE